jgi:hypothetical protein
MVKPRINKRQWFPVYRYDANYLTVRAGSPLYAFLGSIHRVIGGYFHLQFEPSFPPYDVAVLWVCAEFDIPVDSTKHVMRLW